MEPYIYRRPNGDVLDIRGTGEVAVVTVQPIEGDDSATIVIPADDLGKVFGALREACGLPPAVILERSSARFPEDGSPFRFGDFGFQLYPGGVAPSLPGIVAKAVPPAALRELASHLVALADDAEANPQLDPEQVEGLAREMHVAVCVCGSQCVRAPEEDDLKRSRAALRWMKNREARDA